MVPVTPQQLHHLAPNIRTVYAEAFQSVDEVLAKFHINDTPKRLRHFMAQILHVCGLLTLLRENMNYTAEQLTKTWPKRFQPKGPLDPNAFAHQPERIGNEVYANRMGNGLHDGYLYRGRGLIQTTGRAGYRAAYTIVSQAYPTLQVPNFETDPEALLDAAWCLKVAAAEYESYGCNVIADKDNGIPEVTEEVLQHITILVNGGLIGLADREDCLRQTTKVWP